MILQKWNGDMYGCILQVTDRTNAGYWCMLAAVSEVISELEYFNNYFEHVEF